MIAVSDKDAATEQATVFTVEDDSEGWRLDKYVAQALPTQSRQTIQEWIRRGLISIQPSASPLRANTRLRSGQKIQVCVPSQVQRKDVGEDIKLDVVYQDESVMVINKPAGLVVHPGAGVPNHTLLNALLFHHPELQQVERAGIVHRLDKQTTGLMLVALTQQARDYFVAQLKQRLVTRVYVAIVHGEPIAGREISAPIARHPHHRTLFSVHRDGSEAISHYRVLRKCGFHSVLSVKLTTGRTHQVRVHLQHEGYPIVGDRQYGLKNQRSQQVPASLRQLDQQSNRQMLHSWKLGFTHPVTGKTQQFITPMPKDMRGVLLRLTPVLSADVRGSS